jgi:hypothetical protein
MKVFSDLVRKVFEKNEKIKSINRNDIIKLRFEFIEKFDLAYFVNFKFSKVPPGHKNFLAVQLLQYSFLFDDNTDKLDFCRKFIRKLEIDSEGIFNEFPEDKENLLTLFKIEWDCLIKEGKQSELLIEGLARISHIEKNVDLIPELQKNINILLKVIDSNSRKKRKPRTKIKYSDLFRHEQVGEELKIIFRKFNYLYVNESWCGQSGAKNELAIAYYILKEPEYGFQLIKRGERKPQLIALYEEFGLNVSEQKDENAYTTYRNISSEPTIGDTHDEFKHLLKPLLKYKD